MFVYIYVTEAASGSSVREGFPGESSRVQEPRCADRLDLANNENGCTDTCKKTP